MNQPIPQYEDLKSALETAVKEREIEIAKNFKPHASTLSGLDLHVRYHDKFDNDDGVK